MKLNSINYTSSNNINNRHSSYAKPSFGNMAVGLASFIEKNGFLGEFLTIDTVGMMTPRTVQGYTRNRKELGHLNYKAGREELVRELLSGPAFFYVPISALTLASMLKGKSAKVNSSVIDGFKGIMQNSEFDLKNATTTKTNFINTITKEAFGEYQHGSEIVDEISGLMKRNVTENISIKDRILNLFRSSAEKKETSGMLKAKATELVTKLNKANGKHLDAAGTVEIRGQKFNITDLFDDIKNYLDDFTSKAVRTTQDKATFIEKFHKNAKNLRNAANIFAVAALSVFLLIIPKLYQTSESFPGKDGLDTGETASSDNKKKGAV